MCCIFIISIILAYPTADRVRFCALPNFATTRQAVGYSVCPLSRGTQMKIRVALIAVPFFCLGIATGYAGQKKLDAALFRGKSVAEGGKALLDTALVQADGGSWERIAVGRVHYLGGAKQQGQAIFDDVLGKKHKASDLFRVARVYRE